MRFTFAILLSAIAQTIVSALPIADVQRDLVARDEFDGDLLQRDDRYQVALHRAKVGTEDEHWSLQFHPHPDNTKDKKYHEMHALSNPAEKGVLKTEWTPGKKDFDHAFAARPGSQHHVIGEFANQAKAMDAVRSINKNVALDKPFPGQNCVDCTRMAVDHMVGKKLIKDDSRVAEFHKIHEENKDAVRTTTGTDAKKAAAGVVVPKKEEKSGKKAGGKKAGGR